MNTVYLDEDLRTPGVDHLEEYRSSCFYNLFAKMSGERGVAYERIAAKIFNSVGRDAEVRKKSHGGWDLLVDGKRIELKGSRKASPYDTRGRSYRFTGIRNDDYEELYLMAMRPDDTVEIYTTTFDRVLPQLKKQDKNATSFELSADPVDVDADLMLAVQMK